MSGKISQQTNGSPARLTDDLPANRAGSDIRLPVSGLFAAPMPSVEYTDDHTLTESDIGKVIYMNKASAIELAIPEDNSGFDPSDNCFVIVIQKGAGAVSIVAGHTDVDIKYDGASFSATLAAQNSVAGLIKEGTDSWYLFGDLQPV